MCIYEVLGFLLTGRETGVQDIGKIGHCPIATLEECLPPVTAPPEQRVATKEDTSLTSAPLSPV